MPPTFVVCDKDIGTNNKVTKVEGTGSQHTLLGEKDFPVGVIESCLPLSLLNTQSIIYNHTWRVTSHVLATVRRLLVRTPGFLVELFKYFFWFSALYFI
jgi:hypothetical protein